MMGDEEILWKKGRISDAFGNIPLYEWGNKLGIDKLN